MTYVSARACEATLAKTVGFCNLLSSLHFRRARLVIHNSTGTTCEWFFTSDKPVLIDHPDTTTLLDGNLTGGTRRRTPGTGFHLGNRHRLVMITWSPRATDAELGLKTGSNRKSESSSFERYTLAPLICSKHHGLKQSLC